MQVEVGTPVAYKGNTYICIAIERVEIEELAKEDSVSMQTWMRAGENTRFIVLECESFGEGEIITKQGERLTLQCPGVDTQFIWTSYKIKRKGEQNGQQGDQGKAGEGRGHEAESAGPGNPGGEGTGAPPVGKAGA